jgi:hypothetical protein
LASEVSTSCHIALHVREGNEKLAVEASVQGWGGLSAPTAPVADAEGVSEGDVCAEDVEDVDVVGADAVDVVEAAAAVASFRARS